MTFEYLAPQLFREREFYKDKGIPCPKDVEVEEKEEKEREEGEAGGGGEGAGGAEDEQDEGNTDYHRLLQLLLFLLL